MASAVVAARPDLPKAPGQEMCLESYREMSATIWRTVGAPSNCQYCFYGPMFTMWPYVSHSSNVLQFYAVNYSGLYIRALHGVALEAHGVVDLRLCASSRQQYPVRKMTCGHHPRPREPHVYARAAGPCRHKDNPNSLQ